MGGKGECVLSSSSRRGAEVCPGNVWRGVAMARGPPPHGCMAPAWGDINLQEIQKSEELEKKLNQDWILPELEESGFVQASG